MYKKLLKYNNKLGVISVTNINCTSSCLYQKDGKCTLENVSVQITKPTNDCIYFKNKENKE